MPNDNGSDGPGRKPRITNQDVLDCFHDSPDRCEPLTAEEVADMLDCHYNTARNHLEDLVFTGDLDSKKAGPGKVYWLPCLPDPGNDAE